MKVAVIGCNHHNATVQVRERLAFTPQQAELALDRWRLQFPETEAVLISTCNRVELYAASEDDNRVPAHRELAAFLADCHGLQAFEIFDDLFERQGEDAVRHLFMVAASLDSMVLGEAQILNQVKQAYQTAAARQSAGPLSHAIFQRALKVAKRVTTETAIHNKRVSIASVAVADFGRNLFERFDDKQVLVIGAGEMGEETLRYLQDEGARSVTVINRSFERAEQLANTWKGQARPWHELDLLLASADVVVSTTGATEPIMTRDRFRAVHKQRSGRSMLILDLAIPRDFDPQIAGEFSEVYLYDLDALSEVCEQNRRLRDREQASAIRIIEDETVQFMTDLNHRATSPVIRRLKQDWEKPKDDELKRLFNKLPQLDAKAQDEIRQSFDRLINKLLHPPLESLRDEARTGVPHALLQALKTLFQIKD